jgi:transcriptional regulator with XRE-family HTH domain
MALDLAKQVRKQAQLKGLMLQEIANKLGIAASNLSMMLHGNPTIGTLQKIADVIGCDVKDFFCDDDCYIICPHCGDKISITTK